MNNSFKPPANPEEKEQLIEQKQPDLNGIESEIETELSYRSKQKDRNNYPQNKIGLNLLASPKKWFGNLPIQRKQLWSLILSDLISVVGLFIVGGLLIEPWETKQIEIQARSELAVTKDNYQNKIEQMGLSFKILATNETIIAAAQKGEEIAPELRNTIKQKLKEKTQTLQIEYATLVGKDLRIIANANRSRENEFFSPESLVEQVFANQNIRQIQANGIVSWRELEKEKPPLPKGFNDRDALIRYAITPVKDPNNGRTIGALISGDIINNKTQIPKSILEDFNGGYSGIYFLKPNGEYVLATGVNQGKEETIQESERFAQLPDLTILEQATQAKNDPQVGKIIKFEREKYTLAAISLPKQYQELSNSSEKVLVDDRPVAILVRGTPQTALEDLRTTYYWKHLPILIAIALGVNWIMAILLRDTIATPLQELKETTERFARGDRQIRSQIDSHDEVGQLSTTFNQLADNIVQTQTKLARAANQSMLLEKLASARDSQELELALNKILSQIRHTISVDRAIIYKFDPDWQGTITAESVTPGFPRSAGQQITDSCFGDKYAREYQKGRIKTVNNIYESALTECHLKLLEPLKVKASVVVPIKTARDLYGLLIVHQCTSPRQWQKKEIDYLLKFATEIGWGLNAFILLEDKLNEAQRAKQNNQNLQQELLKLVNDVENLSRGDLTVRAAIEDGEISIVADLLNSAIDNLEEVVTLVKKSAREVNNSVAENQNTISLLASRATEQTNRIDRTRECVEKMTVSIKEVASNARDAAKVARSASTTANLGGEAMEKTVDSILQLQETISATTNKVKRLGQSSQEIAKAISLINQIALKTKVLAVNAGIEAGRAGEEGQGFVIVAEEVGKLAAQSATATKQIEQIVENIQIETSELAKTMKVGTVQIEQGTRLLKDTKSNLIQLVDVSRRIDLLVDSISAATISQAETSQSVNSLMQEIAAVSQETSKSSDRVSHSLQQTVKIAEKLQLSVQNYKVQN
ncbi:MAG: methyl-accepting chemotaxis protein [Prochloraceae cyanobacterium]|nr:methyl-accepting chemotaxis protein [Prochloraceae cyanobacterium]